MEFEVLLMKEITLQESNECQLLNMEWSLNENHHKLRSVFEGNLAVKFFDLIS